MAPMLALAALGAALLAGPGVVPVATPPDATSLATSSSALVIWPRDGGSRDGGSRAGGSRALPVRGPARTMDLGTVSGTYTLLGPAAVPEGGHVVFVLSGPARVVRQLSQAPYQIELDTTAIPDGRYRLTVAVLTATQRHAQTYRLTVVNTPANTPIPVTPPAPAPDPVTTEPAPPTTVPATTAPPTTAPPTTVPPTTVPPTTAPPANPPAATPAAEVLNQTNAQRAANGCAPLTVDARLTTAAQAHSADMAAHGYFAHDSQDGRSPFDRMTAASYRFSTAGENIAMGYRTAADVMTGWMNSPGHRANILNCSFTNIGIGYATTASGTPYWTQDFGRPA